MEATLLGKALTGLLLALAATYVLFLRPWRPRRLWERRVPAVDGLFVLALATGLVAIHVDPPFERIATVLVAQTDLPETLAGVDARIREVEELPERIWSDITARLGWTDAPPPAADPEPTVGPVTTAVLPALTAVVEVLVRAFVYWGCLIALAVCLVMRLAVGMTRAVVATAPAWRRHGVLEGRVAELEEVVLAMRHVRSVGGPES
jgi:hypothetical protein